jgi:TIR domain
MLYDAFICHASEDKKDFVRPLAAALAGHHLEIWYDEFSLSVGDSLRQAIDEGLAKSRFGIVVLSPDFFRKGWAQRELDGLVARQVSEERRLILPIWHNVTAGDIVKFSPPSCRYSCSEFEQGSERG